MTRLAPSVPYYGSKQTLGPAIAALLPAHEHYVEPYAGSLAVLLAKRPSRMETVNDLDGDLMHFWKMLRDDALEVERVCALTPHSRAEYEAARDADLTAASDLERARLVFVRLTQGRAGTMRRTGWRHYQNPAGCSSGMPRYLAGYVSRLAAVAERLAMVSLECRPALDLIAAYGRHPEVLLYVDPPYLGTTRAANYRHEMRSEAEHAALADALHGCKAAVVLSGYHSLLYDDLYAGWHRIELDAHTGQANDEQDRTEVLWFNRPVRVTAPSLFEES
ncbi:DNA adenine methylase [Streptosporangium sp. NBC_01810]|uniref:DNA adenine methylase n=1 Tax=Streptosporangium sp. NBC_01810 TaxID=2975951 RepID=UPI002DDA8F0A|nr:DNA adenine methylase [Streptosporangium sp. NBC_01810]WSA27442.1 DNA adenine methylase [Streptosporangium sp. NBC_01810]